MTCGCDLGFGRIGSQPPSKPVGHILPSCHADHATTKPLVTALHADLSGALVISAFEAELHCGEELGRVVSDAAPVISAFEAELHCGCIMFDGDLGLIAA